MSYVSIVEFCKESVLGWEEAEGVRLPYYDSDSVLYSHLLEQMISEGRWRVSHLWVDGGLNGRPTYFSQVYLWYLRAIFELSNRFGVSDQTAFDWSTWMAGPIFYCFCFFLIALVGVLFRVRILPTLFVQLLWVSSLPIQESFLPGRPDHHGLYALLLFLLTVGILVPFCSWKSGMSSRVLRVGGIVSGVSSGLVLGPGLLMVLPVLVLVGFGVVLQLVLTVFWDRPVGDFLFGDRYSRDRVASRYIPFPWRLWGLSGAVTSLLIYLFSFFPSWPLTFEVANPFWIAAFWAAGELLQGFSHWVSPRSYWKSSRMPVLLALVSFGFLFFGIWFLGHSTLSLLDENYKALLRFIPDVRPYALDSLLRDQFFLLLVLVFIFVSFFRSRSFVSSFGEILCSPWSRFFWVGLFLLFGLSFWMANSLRISVVAVPIFSALVFWGLRRLSPKLLLGSFLGLGLWIMVSMPVWFDGKRGPNPNILDSLRLGLASDSVLSKRTRILAPVLDSLPISVFGGFTGLSSPYWEALASSRWAHSAMVVTSESDFLSILKEKDISALVVPTNQSFVFSWSFYGIDPKSLSRDDLSSGVWYRIWSGEYFPWLIRLKETPQGVIYRLDFSQMP